MSTPTRDELFDAYAPDDGDRAHVRMNFVASADGAVTLGGRSGGLGGTLDRELMQVLRTMADVVVVGAGTVRAEGYGGITLADQDVRRRRECGASDHPALAIISGRADLDPDAEVFTKAHERPLVITCAQADAGRRRALSEVAEILVCGDADVDLAAAVQALWQRGLAQILCEGGPHLFGTMLAAGVVDELCLTLAPRLVGGDAGRIVQAAAESDRTLQLRSLLRDDEGFVFLRYAL